MLGLQHTGKLGKKGSESQAFLTMAGTEHMQDQTSDLFAGRLLPSCSDLSPNWSPSCQRMPPCLWGCKPHMIENHKLDPLGIIRVKRLPLPVVRVYRKILNSDFFFKYVLFFLDSSLFPLQCLLHQLYSKKQHSTHLEIYTSPCLIKQGFCTC